MDDTVYNPQRAEDTLPDKMSIWNSKIKGAGLGIWTDEKLPKGLMFGPYQGEVRLVKEKEAQVSGYCWAVSMLHLVIFSIWSKVCKING